MLRATRFVFLFVVLTGLGSLTAAQTNKETNSTSAASPSPAAAAPAFDIHAAVEAYLAKMPPAAPAPTPISKAVTG